MGYIANFNQLYDLTRRSWQPRLSQTWKNPPSEGWRTRSKGVSLNLYRNTIPVIILEDSSWQVRSYTHRIQVGLLGLVGLHGPCQEKHVLRVLNSRSNDQLTNFQESFWTNGDFETADYVCAAEMFGPPLVMPMAHRNKLQQGTMRGLGQVVPPHTGKRLRGCYMMNFSLHPESLRDFDPKPCVGALSQVSKCPGNVEVLHWEVRNLCYLSLLRERRSSPSSTLKPI